MTEHTLYMSRCLELAGRGRGNVSPNPMVGAILACDGRIVGEGYHRRFGEAHAEVNAIAAVRDESLLRRSTLYVNLEPCSHYGKTPPCAELIIRKGIPRVAVACQDPFPEVSGQGLAMLRKAGVEVITGVLEREAAEMNRYFITAHTHRRPYIILKWAQSADGFIDRRRSGVPEQTERRPEQQPVCLSTPSTRIRVHKLRSEMQAIMIGTNTAILDDPSLTVRFWTGRSPLRIVVDRRSRIPRNARLFADNGGTDAPPLVYATNDLQAILSDLYKRNICSLLVEGGAQLHRSFLDENLWDEIVVETAPVCLYDGIPATALQNCSGIQLIETQCVRDGINMSRIARYRNRNTQKFIS